MFPLNKECTGSYELVVRIIDDDGDVVSVGAGAEVLKDGGVGGGCDGWRGGEVGKEGEVGAHEICRGEGSHLEDELIIHPC